MSDFLVDLSPGARQLISKLGLPLPLPQKLARAEGPWQERPLSGEAVVVGPGPDGQLADALAEVITAAGADPYVVGDDADLAPYRAAGEAWGRVPRGLAKGEAQEGLRPRALILDATGVSDPAQLRAVYDLFHPWVRQLASNGRLVVLGRPLENTSTPAAAASQQALDGFVRSAGRELGRKGSTAQLITVAEGAEARLGPVLRWVLSQRAAYVSGQPIHVTALVETADDFPAVRPLEGKVALVTGAARGIGKATAAALAREGAQVIALDRPADDGPLSSVASAIKGSPLLCDVTDPAAGSIIAEHVKSDFEGLDVIVHNAGVTRDRTLAKMQPELWDMTIGVNLAAVVRLTGELDPLIRDGGRIVCLSSIAGISGNVGQTNYSASKAGVIGFVRSLAPLMAPRGITVNAIAPGFIETRLTDAIPVATREVARRLCNLSQGGLPEDIAEAVTFLSSPGAAAMSGQVLRVCGGSFVGA